MKTKQHYDDARNLLGTDKLFNLANKLFHEKEEALKRNDFREASIKIELGHFVCEMLTLKMYYQTDHLFSSRRIGCLIDRRFVLSSPYMQV